MLFFFCCAEWSTSQPILLSSILLFRVLLCEGCACDDSCMDNVDCNCTVAYTPSGLLRSLLADESNISNVSIPVFECNHLCSCDENRCANRVVQKGLRTLLEVFLTTGERQRGFGVRNSTLRKITRGEFVCEYTGEILSAETAKEILQRRTAVSRNNYLLTLKESSSSKSICTYIDATQYGNVSRFINHSCDPNLVAIPVRIDHSVPHIAFFASRYIFFFKKNNTFDFLKLKNISRTC